jgi:hypothetical protein
MGVEVWETLVLFFFTFHVHSLRSVWRLNGSVIPRTKGSMTSRCMKEVGMIHGHERTATLSISEMLYAYFVLIQIHNVTLSCRNTPSVHRSLS